MHSAFALSQHRDVSSDLVTKAELLASFLLFARVFYEIKTGRKFIISNPAGREAHVKTVARELTAVFDMQTTRLLINIPPGHHKSTMLCLFVAWCYAHYPDCNFLYISVSYELAEKHTAFIKEIMEMPEYKRLFGVEIRSDSKAKGKFKTTAGGICAAFGAQSAVVGNDAGLPNLDRFSGGVIMDDMHSPSEIHSDTMRETVIENFKGTIEQRPRSSNVPLIFVGQRLHESDLPAHFIEGKDGYEWKKVILKSLDDKGRPLYPEAFSKEALLIKQSTDPYNFAAQHMQNPQPAGGGIFKPEWFPLLPIEPKIIKTFIVIDSAETDKTWNDATSMSFFGIYRMTHKDVDLGGYALHWLDCREVWVEPKDLEAEFMDFYLNSCSKYPIKPDLCSIEKKSTGSTLLSVLGKFPGMQICPIDRPPGQGSKVQRFYECQKYAAANRVTIPQNSKHSQLCLEHMRKITGNMTHARDDIADTFEMACRGTFINENFLPKETHKHDVVLNYFANDLTKLKRLKQAR